jgi:penicillin-binding protein 1A
MTEKYQSREERRKQLANKKHKGKDKSRPKTIMKRILIVLVIIGIVGLVGGAATFAYMVKDAPKLDEKLLKDPISSEIYDKDGKLVTEIGSEKRDYVEYDDIPQLVKDAVIATEDARFYKHHGVDLIRLGGAVIANFTNGFGSEGASTITQQIVKISFLTPEKTITRKVQEAWLAFQLEQKYTKEEIFEIYFNKVWMNSGGHGIATASNVFYGKPLDELSLPEVALLAGMPQSPANFDPFKHPDRAEKRRNIVLSLMNQHGYISKEEMEKAKKADIASSLVKDENRATGDIPYDSFIGQVIQEIDEKYPDVDPFSDGLKIYTTIDVDAQQYVENMLNGKGNVEFPDEKFQAGITLLDTKTGEIRALGGGRNQTGEFGFNYATDAKRQPGSTIKPILDYAPAIEYLKWGTYYSLDDKPYTYSNGVPINNWDNQHMGVMTMRRALALSRNIPALQALQAVGLDQAQEFANNIGIPIKDIQESYAIGGLGGKDKGVSSLEMAGAYSAFGNNGFYTEPYSVKEIELRDGTKLDMKPETNVVMQDYTAFMITDMLKSAIQTGTGTQANISGLPLAGKTGTTNYSKEDLRKYDIPKAAVPDSWFVGYTTNYTAAVWTGYDNKNKNYLIGNEQKISQHLFKSLMGHVSEGIDTPDFSVPKSVEKVKIEKGTIPAKLAGEYTPKDQILYEYAVKGNAPSETSDKYDKLEGPTNFTGQYDPNTNEIALSWDYKNELKDVKFDVYASQDGGQEQLVTTTSEKQIRLKAQYVGSYSFKVIAVRGEQESEPATVTVDVSVPDDYGQDDEYDDGTDENGDNVGEDGQNGDSNPDDQNQNQTPGTTPTNPGNNNTGQRGNGRGNQ